MYLNVNFMLDNGAYTPTKAHEEDAGFDLRTPMPFVLQSKDEILIDTGVHVEIPKGYVGFLKSKSGLNTKFGVTSEGVIDSGYTGSIKVKLYRYDINDRLPYSFNLGDKITQLVILPIPNVKLNLVDNFAETERGSNGFGSSGR